MSKRLCILAFFVLVFALSGATKAATPIVVSNYSFEKMADGNQVTCHMGIGASPDVGVLGWSQYPTDAWVGVDADCSTAGVCETCDAWHDLPDGYAVCWIHNQGGYVYQVLDFSIAVGHLYTLTWDGLSWGLDTKASFFYPVDSNFPDANHIEVASGSYVITTTQDANGLWLFTHDLKLIWGNQNAAYAGKKLGIKFIGTLPWTNSYNWVDNVRVDWQWASQAYNPKPADAATEVSKTAVLKWDKGGWAKKTGGHDVYFGNTWADVNSATTATAGIFKATTDVNNYDPCTGNLVLGKTYYWRIDEVNQNYTSPPGPVPAPPGGKWKGEIWSFNVEGRARNPNPADDANDVPKNVVLKWMAGADCKNHDVYFGTSESVVEAATTATSGIYKTRINRTTEQYQQYDPVAANPQVGKWYFWRIDEVNTLTVKGYVWGFRVANWILIDDFDFYTGNTQLTNIWKPDQSTGVTIKLNNIDANFANGDGDSIEFWYSNDSSPYLSEVKRTYSPVQDWSYAGSSVTLMELSIYGDANNQQIIGQPPKTYILDPPMYVKLYDGTKTAQINYPDANDFIKESQHVWNIPLKNFSDKGLTLSKISSIVLGMGSGKGEGGTYEKGTVYFDDITLRPPRCVPEYGPAGDITGDCTVDNADLDIMATDWLLMDGEALTETQNGTLKGNPQWVSGHINNALQFDGTGDYVLVDNPRLNGLTSMSITCWVKPTVANDWVGLVCSREIVGCGDDATELGLYGKAYGGPDGIGYDWSCGTEEWQFSAGLTDPNTGVWTFVALSVDPTGASLYKRQAGATLKVGLRNAVAHAMQQNFSQSFWIAQSKPDEKGSYTGAIDDVRIYGYALSFADVNNLAYQAADPNPWPVYWYKFDETSGTTAADSGVPIIVYGPVQSKANLTDPESKLSRSVNFRDYAILADEWLVETLWPLP